MRKQKANNVKDILYQGLTKKQYDFCIEYIKTGNGASSAMKAYDTTDYDTAKSMATELLTNPYIIEWMDEYIAKEMPEEWLMNELRKDVKSKDKSLRINAINNLVRVKGMITEKRMDIVKQREELGQITYDGYAEKPSKRAFTA